MRTRLFFHNNLCQASFFIAIILFGKLIRLNPRAWNCCDVVALSVKTFLSKSSVQRMTSISPCRPLSCSSSSLSTKQENVDDNSKKLLLLEWVEHSDASYHRFEEKEAALIRDALLKWYRENRRKLPWRGDSPPYDGSTSGINSSDQKKKKSDVTSTDDDVKPSKVQSTITNFFQTSKISKPEKQHPPPVNEDPDYHDAIPVSGYGVWVSEIMLQQTRVEAVIPYWLKWMKSFPTVHDLAAASEEEVNAHWAGLGFYRRARLLHQGAKKVVNEYDGELPRTPEGLGGIAGIGPYTASAIASIAFGVCVPVVDGNVCRVLSRLRGIANHIKAPVLKDRLGWELAKQLVEAGKDGKGAGEVNQALMELGATYCAPSGTGVNPKDPLKDFYMSNKLSAAYYHHCLTNEEETKNLTSLSTKISSNTCELCGSSGVESVLQQFQANIPGMTEVEATKFGHAVFPLDPPKLKRREEDLAVAALSNVYNEETWWLLVKRPPKGLLAGQWEFPAVLCQTRDKKKQTPPKEKVRRTKLTKYLKSLFQDQDWTPNIKLEGVDPAPIDHIFSHIKHIMWAETSTSVETIETFGWTTPESKEVRWMREKDMKEVGITSGVKKVLKAARAHAVKASPAKKRKRN